MILRAVIVRENTCKGRMRDEYCGYEIEIQTSDGNIVIEGCHDMGPDVVDDESLPQVLRGIISKDPE